MLGITRFVTAGIALFTFLLVSGCEDIDHIYVEEPPPSAFGYWVAENPEDVGLDEITLALHADGEYTYFARVGYFETEERGTWEFNGYHDVCFTSDYINGHHEHSSWDARLWVLDHDELKFKYSECDCECPVYFVRECP